MPKSTSTKLNKACPSMSQQANTVECCSCFQTQKQQALEKLAQLRSKAKGAHILTPLLFIVSVVIAKEY